MAGLASGVFLLAGTSRAQQAVDWTTWTAATASSADGNIVVDGSTVLIRYTGEVYTPTTELNGAGVNHWRPVSTFTGTGNAPGNAPTAGNFIALIGGSQQIDTVTFSVPVTNPYVALWSVGQPGFATTYNFSAPFTIVAGGPTVEFGGGPLTQPSANVAEGREGNGVLLFEGTFTSLSWTVPIAENYHGFTVGVAGTAAAPAAVPEPGAVATTVSLAGATVLGLIRGRRRRQRCAF